MESVTAVDCGLLDKHGGRRPGEETPGIIKARGTGGLGQG